jgi:hypothetical protein
MEEDFDPFSPRSLASKQKDTVHRLNESSVLAQFQPDARLQQQYALLYGPKSSKPAAPAAAPSGTNASGPPMMNKARKPTVIRSGGAHAGQAPVVSNSSGLGGYHPPLAAKPVVGLPAWPGAGVATTMTTSGADREREGSPPEPAVPPPKAPDLRELTLDDAPPALPPRRPHSEEVRFDFSDVEFW